MSEEITMNQMQEIGAEVHRLANIKKELKAQLAEVESEYKKASFKLMKFMEENGMKKLEGNFGKVTMVTRHYFKATDAEKAIAHLKEMGVYESLRKVTAADMSTAIAETALVDGPNKTKIVDPDEVPFGFEYVPTQSFRVS